MITRRFMEWPAFGWRNRFEELDRLRRQLDRLAGEMDTGPFRVAGRGVYPLINLTEDTDNYYLRAEMPGVKAGDLDVQATADNISIAGERRPLEDDGSVRYHRRERDFGKFSRAVSLPGKIDHDKISAKMENGILAVTIPKAESAKPRQIEIK